MSILITGSGRGIGAATAILAAKAGYQVCINYRANEAAALGVKREIEQMGIKCIAVRANVADEDEVLGLFATIDQAWQKAVAEVEVLLFMFRR